MEDNKNDIEEELTPEEIVKMDELLGFGGSCDCSHCDHGCGDENEEDEEDEEETEDKE